MHRLVAFTFVALLGGCSSSSATSFGPPVTSGPVPLERFCDTYAATLCDLYLPCCPSPDRATCLAETHDECSSLVGEGRAHPGAVYDPVGAQYCVAKMRTLLVGCDLADGFGGPKYACTAQSIYHGTVPLGGACTSWVDCANGDSYPTRAYCQDNKCVATRSIALGGACNGEGSCVDGAWCSTVEGVCKATVPLGGGCSLRGECAGGAPCVDGKCAAPSKIGERCLMGGPKNGCVAGAVCDSPPTASGDYGTCVEAKLTRAITCGSYH